MHTVFEYRQQMVIGIISCPRATVRPVDPKEAELLEREAQK
jgi:hypothetical protein